METPVYECSGCGETVQRRRDMLHGQRIGGWDLRQKYCSTGCFHKSMFRKREAERAAGKLPVGCVDINGYHVVKIAHGKIIKMHRYVMEQVLGRPLTRDESVHHINGNKTDNRPGNLELWVKTHPCGQRVEDKISAAVALLQTYPQITQTLGYALVRIDREGVN